MSEMTQISLFAVPEGTSEIAEATPLPAPEAAAPRLRLAERFQVAMHSESLD
jgi:hypothetical protein